MKFTKFLSTALLSFSIISIANATPKNSITPINDDAAIQARLTAAVKQIMEAQPTTFAGDVARDLSAAVAAIIINALCLNSADNNAKDVPSKIRYAYLVPLFPMFRFLIDKFIRKTDTVDKCLDIMIEETQKLNSETLVRLNLDLKEFEEKILNLSTKREWLRWVGRIIAIVVIIFGTDMLFNNDISNTTISGEEFKCYAAMTIEFLALAAEMATQSGTYIKWSRMKKFAQLKELVEQASKSAQANSAK